MKIFFDSNPQDTTVVQRTDVCVGIKKMSSEYNLKFRTHSLKIVLSNNVQIMNL